MVEVVSQYFSYRCCRDAVQSIFQKRRCKCILLRTSVHVSTPEIIRPVEDIDARGCPPSEIFFKRVLKFRSYLPTGDIVMKKFYRKSEVQRQNGISVDILQ